MASYFLDTSAVAKLYVREAGTDQMLALAGREDSPNLVIVSLCRVELCAAIRRRVRSSDLPLEDAQVALRSFQEHLSSIYIVQPVTEGVLQIAVDLLDRHELRAYDAVQLAACLSLSLPEYDRRATFVCADRRLCGAAEAEGLRVVNPSV
jgi:predicted nucleic acid-binding protein